MLQEILQVNPSDVIILEGILIFHDPRVRELMNMKIFVDTGYLFSFFYVEISYFFNRLLDIEFFSCVINSRKWG